MVLVPVMDGTGFGFTTVVCDVVPVQPFASVTVTVNVFAMLTLMDAVDAPVFHW